MKKNIYDEIVKFKKKFNKTVAFRIKKHASVIDKHLNPGEEIVYVFCGQKNKSNLLFCNSYAIALTNKRLILGHKRLLWGYFYTTITPDLYNDMKVIKGLFWSNIEIDTVKEVVYISKLDHDAPYEIETYISEFMMEEKKKYAK